MSALVKSVSIDNLLNQRECVREALVRCHEAACTINQVSMGLSTPRNPAQYSITAAHLLCRPGQRRALRIHEEDAVAIGIKQFDATGWQYLLAESGMRSLMDATARSKWDDAITKLDVPELTRPNIESTFARLHDSRAEMFERGVIAVFQSLSWEHKTNLPAKFGKRIVVTGLGGYHADQTCDRLDDLIRVLHVMDGKPEPDHRHGAYMLLSGAGALRSRQAGEVDTEYLHIRFFMNGNAHVTFKRADLVERMNQVIAKHYPGALPEPK